MTIKTTDTDALQAALDKAQGRASARLTDARDVARIVETAEKRLEMFPKALWRGTTIYHTVAGPSARSYGHSAYATFVVVERRSADWVLRDAGRVQVYPGQGSRLEVVLPADLDQTCVIQRLLKYNRLTQAQAPAQVAS